MTEDRLFTAFKKMVQRVLTESDDVDFRALYPAKIVKWQSDGVNPSGTVDVLFDDQRLAQKSGAVILPAFVGNAYVPKQGTRVLVGWQGGDERYPYIAGWLGSGGGGNSRLVFVADRVNIGVDSDADVDIENIKSVLKQVLIVVSQKVKKSGYQVLHISRTGL